MNKNQLLAAVKELTHTYKNGSGFCPERSCQLFGVATPEIDAKVGHHYTERRYLTRDLNKLADDKLLIKLVQNGQPTKWMPVE